MYSEMVPGLYWYCSQECTNVSEHSGSLSGYCKGGFMKTFDGLPAGKGVLTSFGASLLMVFSDSHHTAAPAIGTDTAMPAHHSASFLASAELNIDRLLPLLPSVMMPYNGLAEDGIYQISPSWAMM